MKKLFALMLALTMVLSCAAASAAIWPNGTPTVYIGYGAGGGTDTAVRPVVAAMSEYLGETINCVNMEGANSAVACDYVLSQPHDGYTFFATGTGGFSSYPIYNYSTSGWGDWISFHPYSGPAVVFSNPSSGITTVEELYAYLAQGNNFGIGAYGNGPHTQFEAITAAAGQPAPQYALFGSCNDAGVATIAGDVQVGAASLSAVIDYINSGLLTPIFVTCADAFEFTGGTTPSVTTLIEGTEGIPNLNETWPIMIPRDTPEEIVAALTEAFNAAIETEAVKEFAASKGYTIIGLTGEEADQFMSYSISGYSWTLYNAGLGEGNPADYGIPTLEEYDWDTLKLTVADYQ
ncbi:MAG: tripartite tricarboxylate transporter substrate-binding protein [Clostridia bacterium]|nr:tripartite tricarboxylate transporter substrate-binding protein [Clostridia bacterium]